MGEYSWEASSLGPRLGGVVGEYSWEASWVSTAGRHLG